MNSVVSDNLRRFALVFLVLVSVVSRCQIVIKYNLIHFALVNSLVSLTLVTYDQLRSVTPRAYE